MTSVDRLTSISYPITGWLDPVRAVLDTVPKPRPVFFRYDDAGWNDDRLARLLEVFLGHGVALDLAVVPTAADDKLVTRLVPAARDGAVRLHQHGFGHHNHEPRGRRYEFGPTRDRDDLVADLAAGALLLDQAFGSAIDPVFTPPWNRCTPATGQLLVELGWRVLSRDHTADPLDVPGLCEIPVTLDWSGRTRGEAWGPTGRARRLAMSLARPRPTGIMLHHAVTGPSDLVAIDELIGLLVNHPMVVPTTILDLAGAGDPAVVPSAFTAPEPCGEGIRTQARKSSSA